MVRLPPSTAGCLHSDATSQLVIHGLPARHCKRESFSLRYGLKNSIDGKTQMISRLFPLLVALGALVSTGPIQAAEPEVQLAIKNHRFEPAELKVPAGQRIKLLVHNQDPTPEEFESHALNREKVIPGGAKATLYIGPLKPGRYDFFGEFNEATAKGTVVAE